MNSQLLKTLLKRFAGPTAVAGAANTIPYLANQQRGGYGNVDPLEIAMQHGAATAMGVFGTRAGGRAIKTFAAPLTAVGPGQTANRLSPLRALALAGMAPAATVGAPWLASSGVKSRERVGGLMDQYSKAIYDFAAKKPPNKDFVTYAQETVSQAAEKGILTATDQLVEQVKPWTKAVGKEMGLHLLLGVPGAVGGWALGSAAFPDDKNLPYEKRRRQERWRNLSRGVGAYGLGIGGALLAKQLLDTYRPEEPATKKAGVEAALRRARNQTHTHPTPGQASAGNYKHGVFKTRGFTIKLENPEGSTRRGVDKSGKKWSQTMTCDYGYFQGINAVDGDKLDVFIGPDPEKGKIFVVDQHLDGGYDESKVIWGIADEESARKLYLSNYQSGWKGLGHIREMSEEKFKEWVTGGQNTPAKAAALRALVKLAMPVPAKSGPWLGGTKAPAVPSAPVASPPGFAAAGIKPAPGILPRLKSELQIPGLNPTAQRTIPKKSIQAPGTGLDMGLKNVRNIDGTPGVNALFQPASVEDRPDASGFGTAIPAVYDSKAFASPYGTRPSTPADFHKYFTEYANKVRPEGLSVRDSGARSASARTGGEAIMRLGGDRYHSSPETSVHELTHTMQPSTSAGLSTIDRVAQAELPAVLAGASVGALRDYHDGSVGESQVGIGSEFGKTLQRRPDVYYPGVPRDMMARQAAKYMYGKDVDTWQDTGPAQTMNELLATRAGHQFVDYLGTPRRFRHGQTIKPGPTKDITDLTTEEGRLVAPDLNWQGVDDFEKKKFDSYSAHLSKQASDTLTQLLKAKDHSDKRQMTAKAAILRRLIAESPTDFEVDQPDVKYPGLTHKPTGFRIHAPKRVAAGVST